MRNLWSCLRSKSVPPTREQVDAVQQREVAEAARQRLVKAMDQRQREVEGLFEAIIPKRGAE